MSYKLMPGKGHFVILAESFWDAGGIGGNSGQQYTRALLRMGWTVSYVEPDGSWKLAPTESVSAPEKTIVLCCFPCTEDNFSIFRRLSDGGARTVCLIVDDWTTMGLEESYKPELESEFVKTADKVFACNPLNIERLLPLREDIELLRNGVDLLYFEAGQWKKPISLQKGRLTLGVVASFYYPDWIDLDPLLEYAVGHPEDVLHLVGNVKRVAQCSRFPSNVIVHGVKHWMEIPVFIHQFDLCIVPYNPETTSTTNPIKVLEYLACGKPVLSCPNPSLFGYPYLYFYRNGREFGQQVKKAASKNIDKIFLRNFLSEQTWEKRIQKILSSLEGKAG